MTEEVRLAAGALGKAESIIMGIAGAAPAFTISAAAAVLIGTVGSLSLMLILLSALVMFGIAHAFRHLNGVTQNAGASYALVGMVFGPGWGFLAGWAALVAFALAMVSAAVPAATATLMMLAPDKADSTGWVVLTGAAWFTLVSAAALRGIRHASVVQISFMLIECGSLLLILAAACLHLAAGPVRLPDWSWVWPTHIGAPEVAAGILLTAYFYWGWDVTINLSEETGGPSGAVSGGSGLWSVVNLLLLYALLILLLLLTLTDAEAQGAETAILFVLAERVLPAPFSYLAVLAVVLSAVGTLETQILQFTRSLFAMARDGHFHPRLARLHPQWRTPHLATLLIWMIGIGFLAASSVLPSVGRILESSIAAIGLQISTYLGLTGLASAWHFRDRLGGPWRAALTMVVWPLVSAVALVLVALVSLPDLGLMTVMTGFGCLAFGLLPYRLLRHAGR